MKSPRSPLLLALFWLLAAVVLVPSLLLLRGPSTNLYLAVTARTANLPGSSWSPRSAWSRSPCCGCSRPGRRAGRAHRGRDRDPRGAAPWSRTGPRRSPRRSSSSRGAAGS
ncbi:hypothetical protein NKG05_20225 [Oerskovia sp. M15]